MVVGMAPGPVPPLLLVGGVVILEFPLEVQTLYSNPKRCKGQIIRSWLYV